MQNERTQSLSEAPTGNSLFALRLYRLGKVWAFDDGARGLFAEPFVAGMTEMIDFAAEHSIGRYHGPEITVTFSPSPFPGMTFHLEGLEEEAGGRWYKLTEPTGWERHGWLCPAVLKYLPEHPDHIYAAVAP